MILKFMFFKKTNPQNARLAEPEYLKAF